MKNLETLIKNKKAKITIIGLGYVGLPLAVVLAEQGFRVFGFDVQKNKVKLVNQGHSYIADISSADLQGVLKSKKFSATTDKKILKLADVIIICVPTPLDKYKQPDITYIQSTVKEIARFIRKGQLIILESTTYPGTTREVILPVLQKSGLKVGKDFFLAFSPERIDPGNQKFNVRNVPKVVGGITPKCTKLTNLVYRSFLEKVFKVSSPEAAEMTKILENTFRIVNVSMINELALLCGKMGIDIWEVIEAAKTKPYGFMPFYPGPGIGGHCIPLDPFYLSWKAKEYGFYTRFIELGGEINDGMPHFVVTKVISGLNQHKKSLNGAKVLVWGVAYKKDVADPRESASYHVIRDLWKKGANVEYFDPYIPEFRIDNKNLKSIEYQPKNLKHYDCVLILADHSNLNYDEVAKKSLLVVDTRNAIKNRKFKNVLWL
ncbi:MAG: nucleotide sugar dehydrogenase [Patescibacteria group bacterium]|nr:nucleotide sugar dehydrogenase [Patescibacteria group bacterium]MDD5164167.1 nucleotide sugar dehydrogenase [Patescibacteria group bacterium]MDD5534499.1 nucleotide sugar dehydrogenase [Patescibacteria group bacterium]